MYPEKHLELLVLENRENGCKKAAIGLDMKVISYIPRPEGKEIPEYVKAVPLEQLLNESDFISFMCREALRTRI